MNQVAGRTEDGKHFVSLWLEPGIPRKLDLVIDYSETPVADARQLTKLAEVTLDERQRDKTRPHCPECRPTPSSSSA